MSKTDSYFKTFDQHRLYYECHGSANPKAVLIVVHGFGEHCGRYQNLISYFQKDYTLYLYDQRGHGRSDGIRAYVSSFNDFVEDLAGFVDFVAKKEKGKKVFLVGHSMGGQVVLNYLGTHPDAPLTGFITSSANIQIVMPIHPIKRFVALNLAKIRPRMRLVNDLNPKWISRDQQVVRDYKRDALVIHDVTISLASAIIRNLDTIMDLAPEIKLPALMMHAGDDRICAKQGTLDFFEKLGSEDKKIKIYEACYHELFNELCKEQVFTDMKNWLNTHLA